MKNNKITLLLLFLATALSAQQDKLNKYEDCGKDSQSILLAKMLIESGEQHTQNLTCNKVLSLVALNKAKAMAKAGRVAHNINNTTPNQLLRRAGVSLPFIYEVTGNQVESISGGKSSAQEAFDYFMSSPDHKAHLMGENDFYLKQSLIGVGHFFDINTKHMDYWVVYITSLKEENESVYNFKYSGFEPLKKKTKKPKHRFKKGDSLHWQKFKK